MQNIKNKIHNALNKWFYYSSVSLNYLGYENGNLLRIKETVNWGYPTNIKILKLILSFIQKL